MNNATIKDCTDVSWHYCAQRDMTQLRALCPMRCNCHVPPLYQIGGKKTLAGYFQSPQGGCPRSCQAQLKTSNEIRFVKGDSPLSKGSTAKCLDLVPESIIFSGSDTSRSSEGCLVNNTIAADCSELPSEAFWWLTFAVGL